MKKALHIAKANLLRSKGASISLFIIIAIISALSTISVSLFADMHEDYRRTTERYNSLHSVFVMPRSQYNSSYTEFITNDPRISQFEQKEVLFASGVTVDFGPTMETNIIIADIGIPITISAPYMLERDESIPRDQAVYLPRVATNFGYEIGSNFYMLHRNREITLTVAGFFEATELSVVTMTAIKIYVPNEGYQRLSAYFGRSVWMASRLYDLNQAQQFNMEFNEYIAIPLSFLSGNSFIIDIQENINSIESVFLIFYIIMLFAFILVIISLMVVRFRVANSIENTMHEIGVLKAQGYTSRQIAASYIAEYGMVAVSAALVGMMLTIPAFGAIRQMLFVMSGIPWGVGINVVAGVLCVIVIAAIMMAMVLLSTRRIKKLPPIVALRGGMATNNFRRNFFPLNKFGGGIHLGLGLKNMFAYFKLYAMIAVVIGGAAFAVMAVSVIYQNFVLDATPLLGIAGTEAHEMSITVTRHTDAFALAGELNQMPEVRMTIMQEFAPVRINNVDAPFTMVSDDFTRFETITPSQGRLPIYDNEIAMPLSFARRLGVVMGDGVRVTAGGVTREYIVVGHFPVMGGVAAAAITAEGYRWLIPNYMPRTISVYFNDGVNFDEFAESLTQRFSTLNTFEEYSGDEFSAARARAEERIAFYLEHFGIDSVEYAVILDGEIIISGSSYSFQIERITDNLTMLMAGIEGGAAMAFSLLTQLIVVISVIVVSLILSITVRSIIAKRRRELGILKASGFTTKQLVRQMAVSFLPLTTIGIIAGCIIGALVTGPMLGAALAVDGMFSMVLHISPFVTVGLCVTILVIVYLVAYVSARSIKHVSAYELLSE